MEKIHITLEGASLNFDLAKLLGDALAGQDDTDFTLVSWNDSQRDIHSPQCLHCEIKGEPGWEVYGRNHGGRLRLSFNRDTIVLIYS
ncbi:AF1514 family protein [Desulfobulbus rhabdoformis]|uniref:AF1514 family protein n=1 Tax=Desulfobulbus rhabdoformis TaxID=34032 RepID=UPI0019641BDD|nr:AF1514 family protein [Desulfobulbus rhabdoformis]MBM9613587.1 AF1514 family protein [Desulfobulbus rhabdoformis]